MVILNIYHIMHCTEWHNIHMLTYISTRFTFLLYTKLPIILLLLSDYSSISQAFHQQSFFINNHFSSTIIFNAETIQVVKNIADIKDLFSLHSYNVTAPEHLGPLSLKWINFNPGMAQ